MGVDLDPLGGAGPADVHLDVTVIRSLGDELSARAGELRGSAGEVSRHLPDVPNDAVGLAGLLGAYDAARVAFDQRVADLIDGAGERAILQVLDSCRADAGQPYIPLPESAR